MIENIIKFGIPKELIDLEYIENLDSKITRKDKIHIICSCGRKQFIQIASIVRVIKRTSSYQCNSCSIKLLHQNEEFVKKHSNGIKKSWTEEKKQKQSIISKKLWSNPEFKEKQRVLSNQLWDSEEKRQKASKQIRELWKDDEYRKKHELKYSSDEWKKDNSNRIKEVWKRSEYRAKFEALWNDQNFLDKLSNLAKELWKNNDYKKIQEFYKKDFNYREKMSIKIKELWKNQKYKDFYKNLWKDPNFIKKHKEYWTPERRKEAYDKSKKLWNKEELKIKHAIALSKWLELNKISAIERISHNILNSLNIEHQIQYPIGHYIFDLFIPSHDLLIECQGEYWHAFDQAKRRDASKFTYIDTYFPQYRILYLYERDFLNPGIIKQKLIRELFQNNHEDQQIDFSFPNLVVRELSVKDKLEHSFYSAPEEFLQSFHYAGFGRSSKKIFGAYLDDQLIAVCKFAGIVRKEVATSLQYTSSEVLELDRFCIHPQYQKKNFASWFISRCSKLLFNEFNDLKCLVSFADATYGHSGVIYKAAGWQEVSKVKPDYHYVNEEGFVLHKKTLYNHAVRMKKTEAEYARENGYFKVYGKEKIKFIKNK